MTAMGAINRALKSYSCTRHAGPPARAPFEIFATEIFEPRELF